MSLKKDFNLIRAVHAAGFKLVGSKSLGTDDGACWEATLAQGSTKLVRVFNGGFGGPDETFFLETQKVSIKVIKAALNQFFAIPEIQEVVRDYHIELKRYELEGQHITQEQFEKVKAEISAAPVVVSEEAVEISIGHLSDCHEQLKRIKRLLKTKILFTKEGEGDETKMMWYEVKAPDTPANRAALRQRHKIDCFLADLVAGL